MKFPMIFADERGETHFGVHELAEQDLAMGPPPFDSIEAGSVALWHAASNLFE